MSERKRLFYLILIITAVALIVACVTIYLLYRAAISEQKERLVETAVSQARLIEAVARFDAVYNQDIVFLLRHRHHDLDQPKPVPFDSELAEPMRRALSGLSGTVKGLDYRGELVLAAYEPVAELNLGIVAKIDLAEVRAPFVRAAAVDALVALLMVLIGSGLFIRISSPIIRRLQEYSQKLEQMVEQRTGELRDAQEQLVRREKLAVLGQLAGGVSHELRNPLGAIKNAIYFLNLALEKPEPKVKESLEILEKETASSERIISRLLDFASPKQPIRRRVDINDLLQRALSNIPVPVNVEAVSPSAKGLPAIPADPDQLLQVFQNIILNAIQAMPEGGRFTNKAEVPEPE